MKKILLFLMLALFCIPWAANAQVELTVYAGTNTNNYVPFNGLYADYGTRSQFIIPSSDLEEMAGGTISNLVFYCSQASLSYDEQVTVYMKEVDFTTFASAALEDWASMTPVYTGTIGATSNQMEIELDAPYIYGGGNLMIGFQVTTWGSSCPSSSWYGVNQTSGTYTAVYNNASSSHAWNSTINRAAFIPKTTFTYTIGNTCARPDLESPNISAYECNIGIIGGSGVFNVEYKVSSDETWTVFATEEEMSMIALEDLTPATTYQVRIQSVCGEDPETGEPVVSSWKTTSFTTQCGALNSYPWSTNLDNFTGSTSAATNNLPMCWNYINECTHNTYKGYPIVYSSITYAHSGSNSLRFYSYYSSTTDYNPQNQYAILPEMVDLNGKILSLSARGYNANSTFKVGLMSDPADVGTFQEIANQEGLTTSYQDFNYTLEGEGKYVAIMIEAANAERNYNGVYIDDISIVTCPKPTDLVQTGSTIHTATLSWTNGSEDQTAWQICLNGNENNLIVANSNPFTIENLDASSAYTAKVRAYCSETDQSYWSNEISFSTECEAISTLPWNENFNAYTAEATSTTTPTGYPDVALPVCWQFLNRSDTSSTYPQAFFTSATSYAVSGNCLFFKSSSTTPLYAVLPEFAENIANLMLTFTYRNEGTSTSNGTLIVGYMTNPTDTATFTSVLSCNQTTTLTEMEVLFADAPAGSYIAFKYKGGTNNNYYLAIDDVMVGLIPPCMKPSALMLKTPSSRTAHTATLKWTNGTEDQDAWQIAYSTDANFDPNAVNAVDVTTNPATISGLAASTTYYAYVRANCGNDGFSAWCKNKASFTTPVGNAVPTGLTYDPASLTSREVSVSWTGVATNDLHESFDLYYSTESTMPEELVADNLIAGITDSTYHFENLTPETQYYVWVRDNCGNDGYSNWSSSINFTMASDCQTPDGLVAAEITKNSAVITWNTYGLDDFSLQYTADGDNWMFANHVNSPYTLTQLESNTTYQVQVIATCDTSSASPSMSFTTKCDAVVEFPWNEDFESYPATTSTYNSSNHDNDLTDNCWVNEHISGSGARLFQVSSYSSTTGNTTKKLVLPDMSSGTMTKLVLPEMNIPTGVNYQFKLDVYRNASSTSYPEEGIRVFASTDGEIEGATEMAFISRNCTVSDNNLIPAEQAAGWYTYELPIPFTGTCFIILRGESKFGSSTYMDNFIVREIPSCLKPTNPTAANITSNTAELSWTANSNEQAWTVYYKKTTEEEYRSESADSNPFVLENLDAASNYECYVVANCSADDASDPSVTFTFVTECEVITSFPWSENFDSYTGSTSGTTNNLPVCWNYINTSTYSTYKGYPIVYNSSSSASSTPNSLRFYSYAYYSSGTTSYDPQDQYAILPEMEDLDGKIITMKVKGTNVNSTFYVGLMTDPTDASTFVPFATQTPTTSYEEYEFTIAGEGHYLAIKIDAANQSQTTHGIYVDDIAITFPPACPKPTNVTVYNIQPHIVTVGCESTYATEWEVRFDGNDTTFYASEMPYTLEYPILTAGATHTVEVRAYCGDEGAWSEWSNPISFTTACEAVTEFPWNDDFEEYSTGNFTATCWQNEHIEGTGTQIFKIMAGSSYSTGNNTTKVLQLPDMAIGTMTKLVLPAMTLPSDNYQFTLDVYRSASTYNDNYSSEGIRVFASTNGEIEGATELAFIPRQYQVSNDVIGAEDSVGWYTYQLPIGISGDCYIILRGESQYCTSTYMDNFVVEEMPATNVTQTISLASGTNWVSFYVETNLNDLKAALVATGNTAITIQGKTQNTIYNPNNGRWTGQLRTLDLSQMYIIKVADACEITLDGMLVDPSMHPATIVPGVNYIAYPFNTNMTVTNAFAGFGVPNDQVQSRLQNANYNGSRWLGQLRNLESGKGYKYKSASTETRTFTFPSGN